MNAPSPFLCGSLCAALFSGVSQNAHAQQMPEPAPSPLPAEVEMHRLPSFEVRSERDEGYRVQNSVATTGVAQALIDTPLPITVVTSEFLQDAGLDGFMGALRYVSGVRFDPHSGNGNYPPGLSRGNSQQNGTTFRGQPYNGTYRNGLRLQFGFATENVDRIEVAKGPMAVFVGGATLGGEVNLITKQPLFSPQQELFVQVGSHESIRASLDLTGPISRTLAYRLIADYRDGNTWREHSHSKILFVNPQLLWRPLARFATRLDGYLRESKGNLVSQNVVATENYQRAWDAPPPELLSLGTQRFSGAPPFTVAEYRTRIGQAFGTWRQDVFDTTGEWVSLGTGESLTRNPVGGRKYNWYGPNAGFKEPVHLIESDSTLVVAEWLEFRAIARYIDVDLEHAYYSFAQRQYADGNYPLLFGSGTRLDSESLDGKLEGVLKGKLWKLDGTLLFGGQWNRNKSLTEDAFFDYTSALPVVASPNVDNNPGPTLTGQEVYRRFDPRVHDFPDTRLVTRWPSAVHGAGEPAYNWERNTSKATYAAGRLGVFENRVTLTGGVREASATQLAKQQDPNRAEIPGSSLYTSTPSTRSYMYGASVRLREGLSAYGSYNKGETARVGSLVGRVSFGISPPDIVTPAEQAANPIPNDIGEGKELGLKFDLIKHTLSGSIGWFNLTRGNILVADTTRNGTDPRNAGTEVDSNPATADPGVRQRVSWVMPVDGNTSEGVEIDLIWTPNAAYSLVLGASHLTKNKITVSRPLGTDPTSNRDFLVLNGRPLEGAPDTTFRVFQRYEFQRGTLNGASLALGVRYQSEVLPQAANSAWGTVFPSHTVADLTLGYRLKLRQRDITLSLHINNLFEELYADGRNAYGPPREFFLSSRLKF